MWLNSWAETIIDPAKHHYRPSSVHRFPTKTANSCNWSLQSYINFERTLTTDISSDFMQSKWSVPLTPYLVCHRQRTKGFTSQWSFKQIKKVILHASWRSLYVPWPAIRMLLLPSAVGYPRRTVLIRRYVLTWRLRMIYHKRRIVAKIA